MINENGNPTELYKKLIKMVPANTPKEIERFKDCAYKADKYIKDLVSEVLEEKDLSLEAKKVFLSEILEEAMLMCADDTNGLFVRRETLKNMLSRIREKEVSGLDTSELINVTQMIQDGLQLESVRELGSQILHDKSKIGEHTKGNLQGLYMGNELRRFEVLQRLVVDSIIIHRDTSHIDSFIGYLISRGIKEKSLSEISRVAIDYHIEKIRSENHEISDTGIYEKIYQNYVKKGFLFQGLNGAFVESAEKSGLTTNFSSNGINTLQRIDEIFRSHGVQNVILSKLHEKNIDSYYYLTNDFIIGQHFSYHNLCIQTRHSH